jgi:hypothetical protein
MSRRPENQNGRSFPGALSQFLTSGEPAGAESPPRADEASQCWIARPDPYERSRSASFLAPRLCRKCIIPKHLECLVARIMPKAFMSDPNKRRIVYLFGAGATHAELATLSPMPFQSIFPTSP